jgi:4-amino-4-deoxy-L-arabinose transferase-like glycosyltransferase
MRKERGTLGALTILLATAVALGALIAGYRSTRVFHGQKLQQVVDGDFSSDAWIGPQAGVVIEGFSSLLNTVELKFNPVRIGATEPALVAISLCGGEEQRHTIDSENPIRAAIPFGCSPLRISLRALNFFETPNEKTPRLLGVQLRSVAIRSPVKLPLVSADVLAVAALFLGLLSILSARVASSVGLAGSVFGAMAMLAATFFALFVDAEPAKLEPLAIVLVGFLAGMALWSRGRAESWLESGSDGSSGAALLILALLVGAGLRLYGIGFGLPSNFHPDEVPKVNAIMRMVDQNSLDPQYFLHPSLLLYCTYGMNTLLHLFGIEGSFRDTAFLAGRLVSTTAGVLSIALTYAIGKRLFSRESAGIAALLLAVFPLHVTCSRYLKEDALLTFVVLSCVLLTIVAVQSNRRWLLLFAGLVAGCTAGTKYSGILMVVVPASAPWIASRSWKPDVGWIPWAVAAVVIAPLGFVLTTPYSVLNSAKFIKDFQAESRHMQNGHTVSITAWSQFWMYHFWRSIWPGVSGLVAALAAVALGFLLRRARIEDLMVVGMFLLFYLPAEYVKAKPAPQPERYILPCLPFVALAVGEVLRYLSHNRSRMLRFMAPLAVACVMIVPTGRSVVLAKDVQNDTRDQLAQWMKSNLPAGSKVLMDWKPYCPNFHGEYFQVEHIPRARIIPELDIQNLRNSGAQYLVLSSLFYNRYFSQPESEPVLRQRFREVFQRVPVLAQFEAPSGTYGFHNPTLTLFSLKSEDFERLDQERSLKVRGEIEFTSNEVRARANW